MPRNSGKAKDKRNKPNPAGEPAQFRADLQQLETQVQALRDRYQQVCQDQQQQRILWAQQQQLEARLAAPAAEEDVTALTQQLQQLKLELERLELALESQLFSWRGFGDVFWQTVRFVGIGVLLGWYLKSLSG